MLNGDRPAIKFTPIESVKPRPKFGSAKGLVWMSEDFDEPLTDRKPGSAKGLVWVSDDFDEPLEEFKEYLE